jgi:cellulose synthase/poly-beta-1,6-N-acetylglucosamine synthase-like glycosyltransferase
MDADSLLEKDALLKSMRPFFEDPTTLCVGGSLRVVNGCEVTRGEVTDVRAPRSFIATCQALEYLRAFLFGRVGWDELEATLIISGAFGLFNKHAVIAVGGFDINTVGEDMEIVVRLRRWAFKNLPRHRVRFVAETVCWTEVPESWRILKRQRSRWMRGLMETLVKHRGMIFNPRYGIVGMLALPFFLLFEMLGPIIETVGYIVFVLCWWVGLLNWEFAFWFLCVSVLLGTVISMAAVLLMELTERRYYRMKDVAKLLLFCIFDNFGYRQLHSVFRLIGLFQYFRGKKGWGEMQKHGFRKQSAQPAT